MYIKKYLIFKKNREHYLINHDLTNGHWKKLCYELGLTIKELLSNIQDTYDLDDTITGNLVVSTSSAKTNIVRLCVHNNKDDALVLENHSITTKDETTCSLTLEDLTLCVYIPRGAVVQKDTTCDSNFMLEVI